MTRIDNYRIDIDDRDVPVTLEFSIDATGNPDTGFSIVHAFLTEFTVWLEQEMAEYPPSNPGTERTQWLVDYIDRSDRRADVEEKLAARWYRDRELDDET